MAATHHYRRDHGKEDPVDLHPSLDHNALRSPPNSRARHSSSPGLDTFRQDGLEINFLLPSRNCYTIFPWSLKLLIA